VAVRAGAAEAARPEEETRRQTALLIQEIDRAQAQNRRRIAARQGGSPSPPHLAKSRLCRRLSHETRSPLNAISALRAIAGAGLDLQHQAARPGARGRRSADHLSGLIDRHPDISDRGGAGFICPGDEVRLSEFLDQLVGMFRRRRLPKASISSSSGQPCCRSWSMPTRSGCGQI